MITKWVNRFTPLYSSPNRKSKLCDIPEKTLIRCTGMVNGFYEEILYITHNKTYTGWIHSDDLEEYVRNFAVNVVQIENQTPDLNDFEQYMIYNSIKQVNMCGPLCLANVLNISLDTLLKRWELEVIPLWKRIFISGKARGTDQNELKEILSIFNRNSEVLSHYLYQKHIDRARYTIKGLNNLLSRGSIIMSIKINKNTGLISKSGILHWIVLKTILPERNGQGFVTFYNPAMNSIESCSWAELMDSAGTVPYGVFVPKTEEESGGINWNENRD